MTATMQADPQQFLSYEHKQSINMDAFNDISKVMMEFLNTCTDGDTAHWVCDAAPGHGKTTVLQCVLKLLSHKRRNNTPVLVAFNNKDTMMDFYKTMQEFAIEFEIPDLIQYVSAETVEENEPTIENYLFICITHHRLRDLAIGLGDWTKYSTYQPAFPVTSSRFTAGVESKPRVLVIDEMPILFDECIFDIGTTNNVVAWFDELAKDTMLPETDKSFGRNLIMWMTLSQFIEDDDKSVTTAFHKDIVGTPKWERFEEIFKTVSKRVKYAKWETKIAYRWFKRLLTEDGQGSIDRHYDGQSILCSEYIDYKQLGNVLILDGTSQEATRFYRGYDFRHVENRNDYSSRLWVHWREINTSSTSRKRPDKSVQAAIARDIHELRNNNNISLFPLVLKKDIKIYRENGVISTEFKKFYEGRSTSAGEELERSDERLVINLFNTTGKNDLRCFDALALTSLPIRHPQYYKLKAIGLYGTGIDLSMASRGQTGWFNNLGVELCFLDLSMAELLQIIHRTSLRNINSDEAVHLYMYHKQESWMTRLYSSLGLTEENGTTVPLVNESLYGFDEKCKGWAEQVYERLSAPGRENPFNGHEAFTLTDAGGKRFKDWINKHWKTHEHSIRRIFRQYGIKIYVTNENNNQKVVRLIDDEG